MQDRRNAIRDTWGRTARGSTEVVLHFFAYKHDQGGTGLLLEREAQQHEDLTIINDQHLSNTPLEYGPAGLTQKVSVCNMLCTSCKFRKSLQAVLPTS